MIDFNFNESFSSLARNISSIYRCKSLDQVHKRFSKLFSFLFDEYMNGKISFYHYEWLTQFLRFSETEIEIKHGIVIHE